MKCTFIPQFIILVALGLSAGFVHSKLAPVKTTVDAPGNMLDAVKNAPKREPSPGSKPTGAPTKPDVKTPEPVVPDQAVPPPAAITPSAPSNTGTPSPGAAPAAGDETLTPAQRSKGHITLAEAYTLFKSDTAYFIDTRKKSDYEEGHVKDAFGIPLSAFLGKSPKLVDAIDRSSPIVCYCIGGNCDESDEVAKNLNLMGYKNVYIMHAGFPGWKAAGYPIQTGPGIQEAE